MAEQATGPLHLIPRALAEPTEPVTKSWIGDTGPGQPGDVDGGASRRCRCCSPRRSSTSTRAARSSTSASSRPSAPSRRCWPPRSPARSPTGPRTPTASGHLRGTATPVDAGHGAAQRDQPRAHRVAGQRDRRRRAVGAVQRLPERRVREPERGRARPRPGQPARHGGRAGSACRRRSALVLGTALVVYVFTGAPVGGYLVLAIPLVLLTLPFVLLTPDHPLEPEHRQPADVRDLLAAYWISPRRHPDFAWAWITRFLASLAIGMGTLYLLYFLRDQVHYAKLTGQSPPRACSS